MNDFLDVAESLYAANRIEEAKEDYALVFKGYHALKEVYAKSAIELDNIESLFAAFEMANLVGRLGKLSIEEINKLPAALKQVIEKTLELTITFPGQGQSLFPPKQHENFVELIRDMVSEDANRRDFEKVSIITFNYDLCIDYALNYDSLPIDYCLNKSKAGIKLIKLHGSLNWIVCPDCNEVVSFGLDFFKGRVFMTFGDESFKSHLPISRKLKEFKHCDNGIAQEPMIVPPTWNKAQYHEQIGKVWHAAASELSSAENIFISGYSLPETDMFFRYLYAIGTLGTARIKRLWVFDIDESDSFKRRYEALLGPLARKRFKVFTETFGNSFEIIRKELSIKNK